jgi:hypothetical protein
MFLACLTSASTNYVTSFVCLALEQLRHSGKASASTGLGSFFFQHLISHLSSMDVTLDGSLLQVQFRSISPLHPTKSKNSTSAS